MASDKSVVVRNVTIRDVAEEAGVSISLVSFVMNASRGPNGEYLCSASQQTAERIVEIAERLGYHSNKAAISLRLGCTKTIGIVVPNISNMFFADICQKIERLATDSGYLALMGSSGDRYQNVNGLVEKFLYAGVDGIVVTPCPQNAEVIRKVQERNIPVVLLDRDIPELTDVGRVLMDNNRAGRIAAQILVNRGCKSTILVRYATEIHSILDREGGYMNAIREYGLTPKVSVIAQEAMNQEMIPILTEAVKNGVEGVVFPSNSIMLAGIAAINKLGLKIPQDIEVVGFDQNSRSDIFNPAIPFVNQCATEAAEHVFEMLLSAMHEQKPLGLTKLEPLFTIGIKS